MSNNSFAYNPYLLSLSLGSYPRTFNPYKIVDASSAQVLSFQYEGLTQPGPQKESFIGVLAQSWSVNAEQTEYTFVLKDNLYWSDGHPLTADDVIFTYQNILLNQSTMHSFSSYFNFKNNQLDITKKDTKTILFTFKKPFTYFVHYTFIPIVPQHIWSQLIQLPSSQIEQKLSQKTAIVSGPFCFKKAIHSQSIVLQKNPYYDKRTSTHNLHKFNQVIFSVISNEFTQFFSFIKKSLHIISLNAEHYFFLKNKKEKHYQLSHQLPKKQLFLWGFCLKNKDTFLTEVRQLLNQLINRKTLSESVFLGQSHNEHELFYKPSVHKKNSPLNQLRQLKQNNPDKFPLQISVLVPIEAPVLIKIAEIISQQVKPLNISLTIHIVPFSHLVQTILTTQSWESVLIGLSLSDSLYLQKPLWIHSGALCFWNKMQQNDIFSSLFDQLEQTSQPQKKEHIITHFKKLFSQHCPFIFLTSPQSMIAIDKKINGVSFSIYQSIFHNIGEWYASE